MVGDHHIGPDVELPAVVEQRPHQVLLDDDRSLLLLLHALAHPLADVLQLVRALDPVPSVAELPRLQDPIVGPFLLLLLVEVGRHPVVFGVE